jgi:hypothetical protein
MKKAFTLVVLILTPTIAFAQGTVILQNQTGLVKQWTSATDSTLINVPKNGGYVELIAAPINTPLVGQVGTYSSLSGFLGANPLWAVAGGQAYPIAFGPGLFNSGTVTINNIAAGGANAEYFLIGWTGASTTYEAASAAGAMFGQSAIATTTTGDPLATPVAGFPVSLRPTFAGLYLYPPIPEPSTSALVGLGVAVLLVFRRRNGHCDTWAQLHRLRTFRCFSPCPLFNLRKP